jgi:WD40-like Beta Propeller Repeat
VASLLLARRPLGALFALSLLAACSDALPSGPAVPGLPAPPTDALAVLNCTAQVSPASVTCAPATPATGGAQATIFGGQGVNVRLTASNFATAGTYSFDVTLQNLLPNPIGAADPGTVSGVNVFFYSGPASSSGSVDVYQPDGEDVFLAGTTPYYHWDEVLPRNEVSQSKRWQFTVSPTVQSFQFQVYVQAELMPLVVFDLASGGNRDIYRVAMNGSDLLRLTTNAGDDRNPTASRSSVVFATFRHGKSELYSVPLAGGTETRLTTTAASEGDPALSIDGLRLAYTSDAAIGVSKVWTANPDGTGAAAATPASFGPDGAPEASPAWAPAGSRLALVATGSGSADVYDFTLGGSPSLLAGGTTAEVDPAWSPDGTRLVYTSNVTGAGDLYMLRLSDNQVTRLTSGATAESYGTWTSNGRIVYLVFLAGGATELRWLNPDVPGSGGTIAVTGAPNRPHAVPTAGPG